MSRARSTVVEGEALTGRVPPLTLPQLVRRNARGYGEKTAIVDAPTERRYSYAELDRLIGRFAAGLTALGFRSGDVLLLYTPNQPEWLIAALGAMSAGGVVSGANSQYRAAELEHQLREVRARFVLTTCALLPTVNEAIAKLSGHRVIDPMTQTDVERGVAGEIWFRGPQAFRGYLNNPESTECTITPDGWVRTGDVGYFDADGYLFITDRLKELIKVKGFQVAPAELEALLLGHPAVLDAAVIGRPDERFGELPVAFVVVREPIDGAALMDWVAGRVIEHKQLREIVFCEAIPKSPSGKILRRVLRAQDAQRVTA